MLVNVIPTVVVRFRMLVNKFPTMITRLQIDVNEILIVDFRLQMDLNNIPTSGGCCCCLPDPFRGMGAWRKTMEPQKPGNSPGSRPDVIETKSERRKESVAGQCRMR